ncbi:hypothetical protein CW745_01770 [Psychromonas sp. psych-6C06]|uniref:hypothetical protein n=1 Tax=Psychromonas sp. psych-6C06 TaxID=2058089 RepID=UPI000C32B57F|nr:hypothetical protein [Psychromonas sp. psych-6C06]PKF63599.1 hypothetical protein CW745_01770 [Psychromonas sp. psych-6C06]
MHRYITNNDNVIYTLPNSEDGEHSAFELADIPDIVGVGETLYIAYDQQKVLFEQNYEWIAVNPETDRYDAQLYRFKKEDIKQLIAFVESETPEVTLWQKIRKKRAQPADFALMIKAIVEASEEKNIFEFYLIQS